MMNQHNKDMKDVRINGCLLKDIKNQTLDIALAAVLQNGIALQYVKEQTPEIALAAVTENGYAIKYVKDQTPEIALAAVSQSGWSLQYVKCQNTEIALAAMNQNGEALEFVVNQTPEIALAAVSENGYALKYVKRQSLKIILTAVSQNGHAIRNVVDQTPEIALAAVAQNGYALQYVKNQTHEIALVAVSENGYAIQFVNKKSQEVLFKAWKQAGDRLINFAADNNLIDIVDFLISKNVYIDHISEYDPFTPFQIAAQHLNNDIIMLLSNNGANIHVKNKESQRNVLSEFVACFCVNPHIDDQFLILRTLLKIGVSPTEQDKYGNTAIALAKDKPEILAILKAFELKKLITSTLSESEQQVTHTKKIF
jgi:hypothetical protein